MNSSRNYKSTYEVIRTEEYVQQFNDIYKRFPRSVDLNNSIIWALERYPHKFENITHNFYHWITDELTSSDFPILKILFKIVEDQNKVVLLSVEEI